MALLDKSKASYAFKALLGRAHTSNDRELYNEAIPSGIIVSGTRVFADKIVPNPNDPANTGIVSGPFLLTLEAVLGSDTQSIGTYLAYRCKLGGIVPGSLTGKINPLTGVAYQANDYVGNIIPQSFGDNFRPILYSDSSATFEIPPSSSADWFIDCFSGVIVQEAGGDGTPFILGGNGRLKAYVYTGRFVTDALAAAGTGGSSLSEWKNSVLGFSGNTGSATLSFYELPALTGTPLVSSASLSNGQRWIHKGSTVTGLNIYDPSTNSFSTGNITDNSIVEYYVGTQNGYIVTAPTAGTFTSVDGVNAYVWRYSGSAWTKQEFEKTVPVRQNLSMLTAFSEINGWQALSNDTLNPAATVSEFEVHINGVKLADAVTYRTYSTTEDTTMSPNSDTQFTSNLPYTIGEAIQVEVSGQLFIVNVSETNGNQITVADSIGGVIDAVSKISTTTLSDPTNSTARLFIDTTVLGYGIDNLDEGTLIYYKLA